MGSSPESDLQPDAINAFLAKLPWYIRLEYYLLSDGERKLIRAMCSFSPEDTATGRPPGRAVFVHIPKLAIRAGMSERQAQRLLHGYTREGREVTGLIHRGIISETAPPNTRKRRAATYRVNWDAFAIDPKKQGMLEERMQMSIPGAKHAPRVDEVAGNDLDQASSSPFVNNAVEETLLPGDTVSPVRRHGVGGLVSPCRWSGVTVSPVVEILDSDSRYSSSKAVPGVGLGASVDIAAAVHSEAPRKAVFPNQPKKSAWGSLHHGFLTRLKRELEKVASAGIGTSTSGWTPEQHAQAAKQRVLIAADAAGIWKHVGEALAEETYQAVLEDEIRRAPKFDS